MYVVIVDFTVKPEHLAAFMPAMVANARASRESEPGCRQFDVCVAPDDPTKIFLYELYDDKAAFDAHLKTPHFLAFNANLDTWLAGRAVRILRRADPA